MTFTLRFTSEAKKQLKDLAADKGLAKRLNAVNRALGKLEKDPKHPSLHTHKYDSLSGPNGEDVLEAYAENDTPAAYRIFWWYGPDEMVGTGKQAKRVPIISILSITPHP